MSRFEPFSQNTSVPAFTDHPGSDGAFAPRVDVYETGADLVIEAELPGTSPEDVRLTVRGDTLLIEGVKRMGARVLGGPVERVLCLERAAGPFRRLVRLPVGVDAERGRARLADGVLAIVLPRRHP